MMFFLLFPLQAEAGYVISLSHQQLNDQMWLFLWLFALALFIYFIYPGRRRMLNLIGNIKKFEKCDNCGDSWYWKEMGVTTTMYSDKVKNTTICRECLKKSRRLKFFPFWLSLRKKGWEAEDIRIAWAAVTNFADIIAFLERFKIPKKVKRGGLNNEKDKME